MSQDLEIVDADLETGLQVVPQELPLIVSRAPAIVLEEARQAACALKDVIDRKPNKVIFNGNVYLEFEDWQTVAKFYGATVKVESTKYVEFGDVKGFEARAVVLNAQTGLEISAAEAMCLNDEAKWGMRPKYKTVSGRREKVGEEPTPLFQLKSMAQTRASAKALRNVFAWVVVLAGYKPTPAEEMDGVKPRKGSEPIQEALEHIEGIIETPTLSGGCLFFRIGRETLMVPRFSKSIKEQLENGSGAFVELMVTPVRKAKEKEYREVGEVLKYEAGVPF